MAEVFAWPEMALYVFPAGGASAIMTYCENIDLTVKLDFIKFKNQLTGSFASRTHFQLADKDVTFNFGQMYSDNATFFAMNSATAFNARAVFSAAGGIASTAQLQIWSAVFTDFKLGGREGDLFRASVGMRAADISGI